MQNRGDSINALHAWNYSKTVSLIVLALAWGAIPAWGTDVLRLDVPARSEAMAAGVADSNGSDLLLRNPAGVLGQTYPSLAFTHFTAFQEFAYEQIEGVYPQFWGGSWAASVLYARAYEFTEYDDAGFAIGHVAYHDWVLHLAHARRLAPHWDLGVGLKVFERQLAEWHNRGAALDAGVRYHTPWSPLAVGVVLNNVGAQTAFIEQADSLPAQVCTGAALTLVPGEHHRLLGTTDYVLPLMSGEPGGPRLGVEYVFREWLFLRSGLRLENELGTLSLGFGVKWGGWGLDYSYRPYDFLGVAHHMTLTYGMLPAPTTAPVLRPRLGDSVAGPTAGIHAKGVKPAEVYHVKNLTVLPRNYESSLTFKTPAQTPDVKNWTFEIRDETGTCIRVFTGKNKVPEFIQWDGRNQQGQNVGQNIHYQYVFTADQKPAAPKVLPAFHPVLKFRFEQSAVPVARVKFKTRTRPEAASWSLTLREHPGGRVVRTLTGRGAFPETLLWDGADEQHRVLDSRHAFDYHWTVTYPDASQATIQQNIIPIPARTVPAPAGQRGLLVLGILFDFNSAVLRPDMDDKIVAVADLLEEYGTLAQAVCEGHSDDVGSPEYNQKLSLTRAKMVAQFLVSLPNVPAGSVSVEGFGKERPETQGHNERAREQNRRVEIRVYYPQP